MTDTLRKAAEALRPFAGLIDAIKRTNRFPVLDNKYYDCLMSGVALRNAAKALVAIEAELARVPEDRERLARMRADAMSATIAEVDATDARKLAAEALRQARQWMNDWAPNEAYEPGENHTHTMATQEWIDKALAAIEAELPEEKK